MKNKKMLKRAQAYALTLALGASATNLPVAVDVSAAEGIAVTAEQNQSALTAEVTAEEPKKVGNSYLIETPGQLLWLSQKSNEELDSVEGKEYYLNADISLAGVAWTPIKGGNFKLDGMGFTISGLNIDDTAAKEEEKLANVGLFADLTAQTTVRNLILKGTIVSTKAGEDEGEGAKVGAIAGTSAGTIENVSVDVAVKGAKNAVIGGIVGSVETGATVSKSIFVNTVSSSDKDTKTGMIAGANEGTLDKVFYLDETDKLVTVANIDEKAGRTAAQFESGEVALNLAGYNNMNFPTAMENREDTWFQNLEKDAYPVPYDATHGIVYRGYLHGELEVENLKNRNHPLHENTDDYGEGTHNQGVTKWTSNGDGTHTGECAICGQVMDRDEHTYGNVDGEFKCIHCGDHDAVEDFVSTKVTYGYTTSDIKVVPKQVIKENTLSYQWYKVKEDAPNLAEDEEILTADTAQFPTGLEAGKYYCAVSWVNSNYDDNTVLSDVVTVEQKTVTIKLTGSYTKEYDADTKIINKDKTLKIELGGLEADDDVVLQNVRVEDDVEKITTGDEIPFVFASKEVGAAKNVANDGKLQLAGLDEDGAYVEGAGDAANYKLEFDQVAADIGRITKATIKASNVKITKVDNVAITEGDASALAAALTQVFSGDAHKVEAKVQIGDDIITSDKVTVKYRLIGTEEIKKDQPKNQGRYDLYIDVPGTKNFSAATNLKIGQELKIARYNLTAADFDLSKVDGTNYYTGKEVMPKVSATNNKLKEKVDYTVTYKNNVNVATASDSPAPTVVITGIGNCEGRFEHKFTITQKEYADDQVKVSYVGLDGQPVTTANGSALGTGNWFTSDVKIEPAENYTLHRVYFDEEGEKVVTDEAVSSITLSEEGTNKVSFYTVDKDGNVCYEANDADVYGPVTREYKIDKTLPTAKISIDFSDLKDVPVSADTWNSFNANPGDAVHTRTAFESKITLEYSKDTKDDILTDIASVDYMISKTPIKEADLSKEQYDRLWQEYDAENKPTTIADQVNIVYVRVKDGAGRTIYLNSDKVISDISAPKITDARVIRQDETSLTFEFKPSEAGTYYYMAQESGNEKASVKSLKEYGKAIKVDDADAGKLVTVTIDGFTKLTAYDIFIAGVDIVKNETQDENVTAIENVETVNTQPVIKEMPKLSGNYGDKVSELAFKFGTAQLEDGTAVKGTWKIHDEDAVKNAEDGKSYRIVFTPNDTEKDSKGNVYGPIEVKVVANLVKKSIANTEFVKITVGEDSKTGDIEDAGKCVFTTEYNSKKKQYVAKPHEPGVTVEWIKNDGGDPVVLTKGTHYEVKWLENTNAGTGKIKITGKGIYEGEVIKEFPIAKMPTTVTVDLDGDENPETTGALSEVSKAYKKGATFDITKYTDGKRKTVWVSTETDANSKKGKEADNKLSFAVQGSKDNVTKKDDQLIEISNDAVISMDPVTGKATIKGAGTAQIKIVAGDTANYAKSEQIINVTIAKAAAVPNLDIKKNYAKDIVAAGDQKDTVDVASKLPDAGAGQEYSVHGDYESPEWLEIEKLDPKTGKLTYTVKEGTAQDSATEIPVIIKCNNYEDTTVTVKIKIIAQNQKPLSINEVPNMVYGTDKTFLLHTTGGSTINDVQYSVVSGSSLSIDDEGFVHIIGAGPTEVKAVKPGIENEYLDVEATRTITIAPRTFESTGVSVDVYNANGEITTAGAVFTYTGKPIMPKVLVSDTGAKITADDYAVMEDGYKNNVKPGTATVTVVGKKNYTGLLTASFQIEKADRPFTDATAAAVVYETGKTLEDVKLAENWQWKDETVAITTTGAVTAEAVYVGEDKDCFKSTSCIVTIDVQKGSMPKVATSCAVEYVSGMTLKDVKLPENWQWKNETVAITTPGSVTAEAVYVGADKNCFVTTEAIIAITVKAPEVKPSTQPSVTPSTQPSVTPSTQPSVTPSAAPSATPSTAPSTEPSTTPSAAPSAKPSTAPSTAPSTTPSTAPSTTPSTTPSTAPSTTPSTAPSTTPSTAPSTTPSTAPSTEPSTTPSTTPSTAPEGVKGDYNGDGKVDLNDAQAALKAALKIITLTDEEAKRLDVDGNGKVDITDAQKILKYALKIITEW